MFKTHDKCITKLMCLGGNFSVISHNNLKIKIKELQTSCDQVPKLINGKCSVYNRHCYGCLKKLISILQISSHQQIQSINPHNVIHCCIKILLLFDDSWHFQTDIKWKILCKYEVAMVCFHTLLQIFSTRKSKQVVDSILEFIVEEEMWKIENLCETIIFDMINFNVPGFLIAENIREYIEKHIAEPEKVRNLIGLLEKFVNKYDWPKSRETESFIEKLLAIYHNLLNNYDNQMSSVKNGLEVCLKNLIQHVDNNSILMIIKLMCKWIMQKPNLEDSTLLDYGNLLEFSAFKHKTRLYTKTLTPEILPLILKMISSSSRLISLLGNRIFQFLLDRNNNKHHFDTAKVFLEDAKYDIKIAECRYEDKIFVKNHREIIHDSLMKSIFNHCDTCLNLETTFCTICLIAVEIPNGFTSASLVCLAMNMQNLMLEEESSPTKMTYHIHAVVVSIMSLLCWIHQAKVFFEYVNKIILTRAHWAPHLNPPLQNNYDHAPHHILWNKPELFFVDWEVRYGLWKRFRLRNDERKFSKI